MPFIHLLFVLVCFLVNKLKLNDNTQRLLISIRWKEKLKRKASCLHCWPRRMNRRSRVQFRDFILLLFKTSILSKQINFVSLMVGNDWQNNRVQCTAHPRRGKVSMNIFIFGVWNTTSKRHRMRMASSCGYC